MAIKVLSVEVGYSTTKVCEMDYKAKSPKVHDSFILPTPEGIIADGVLTVTEEFVAEFKKKLAEKNIKTKKVIFTISSSKIATREVRTVYCKENRIADMVRANLNEYFPIDGSQYDIAHTIMSVEGVQKDENGKPIKGMNPTGYRLMLLAAPKQLLDGYKLFAKSLGLELESIDYNGNSIFQAAKEECKEGTHLIVKVDERGSAILVVKDGQIVLNRTVPYGIDDAVSVLMTTEELGDVSSYEAALALARRKTCILKSNKMDEIKEDNEYAGESEVVLLEKKKVTDSLTAMAGGIARVVDYYNSNHANEPIDQMYVTGIGADFSGISKYLSNALNHKVVVLTNLSGVNIDKCFKEVSYGEYVACIGAAIAPLHFASEQEEKSSSKVSNLNVDQTRLAIIVAAGCVLIGTVVIISSLIPYMSAKKQKKEYEETIQELQPVYETYLTYNAVKVQYDKLQALDLLTANRNEELVEVIESLELKMPSSFCLSDMTATATGVSMNVTVETKEEAASVLHEMSQLQYFYFVDTTALTELVTETGEKQYAFSIEMTYAPMVEETEEEVE